MSNKKQQQQQPTRNIGILSANGHTGLTLVDLLNDESYEFKSGFSSLTALCYGKHNVKELEGHGAIIQDVTEMDTQGLKETISACGIDTLLVIPPALPVSRALQDAL